jgi:hypothetical protein
VRAARGVAAMGDPVRLLNAASDAHPLERDLLQSLRDISPPATAKKEVWNGIAGRLTSSMAPFAPERERRRRASLTGTRLRRVLQSP